MPNLAKDMGTQTTISYESSETESDDDQAIIEDQPAKVSMTLDLLQPLEERKKAFLNPEPVGLSPIKQSWKSMPSLNKASAPLPLVGACYPNRQEDIEQLPIKDIKQLFEQKQYLAVDTTSARKRSSSLSSVSSLSSATNPSVIMDEPKPKSQNRPANSQVIYRWDDESNGEIYTDRPDIVKAAQDQDLSSDQESSMGLYVVENGKEYPLIPLRQRKSMFETIQTHQVLSYKVTPLINKTNAKTVEKMSNTKPEVPAVNRPTLLREPPVKSSTVPYIQEEQEVLQKIDLVSKIKPKFGSK